MSFRDEDFARLPEAVRTTAARLEEKGFDAWLVGEGLARLLRREASRAFELATSASLPELLDEFPRAVPTAPHTGVATLPGRVPIDLLGFRHGGRIEDDLAHRDFTIFALAASPLRGELLDPWSGGDDLEHGRLRAVDDAIARFHEDPTRVLRAARVVAEWGFSPDPDVERAMGQVAPALSIVNPARLRAELWRVLLGPDSEAALALLRRTGAERRLVRDVRDDAAACVAAMPPRLELRLAAWLRGARSRALFKRLRFGLDRAERVEQLLALHPLDARVDPTRDRAVLRMLRQVGPEDLEGLFRLRELEAKFGSDTDPALAERLGALRIAIERVRANEARDRERTELAIGGAQIMEWLGCGPGPVVGDALRFAADRVAEDPTRNDPDALREELLAWHARAHPGDA